MTTDLPLIKQAGDILFAPGARCPGFVIVDQGTIRVSLTAANGREVVLYRVDPGDVCLQTFGCLIHGREYSAEGVAETDVRGRIVPAEALSQAAGRGCRFPRCGHDCRQPALP